MAADVKPHSKFSGIYWITLEDGTRRLATENLIPRRNVYGERLISFKGIEYRLWDPFRSKLAAAILKGLTTVPIQQDNKVLYLGAASGTTASHVSDMVGEKGHVYCVEFAARAMRELINNVCAFRSNMTPILEDARMPEKYAMFVEKVDDIYCDIAQPEQAKVLADNAELFLKENGWTMLAVKSQSIDVTKKPVEVYRQEVNILKSRGFAIKEFVQLEPYEKAHAMIVSKI
ncbi:MAG: fibrillarin-like rRNA/tRNA 2'-O-methyltransferase [Candidatus Bathyarchaeota archaeon]|nr:fibrillarin-like rRNA/tRNA 2'-O-methyltransferase [Candidatus Bathyarchaeota archaeon]MDH5494487.1 fibrillarin-like rRNA/tRNA 2'-O-methyltransferase [Candidatus Bathyarchaeota archaeon]